MDHFESNEFIDPENKNKISKSIMLQSVSKRNNSLRSNEITNICGQTLVSTENKYIIHDWSLNRVENSETTQKNSMTFYILYSITAIQF